VPTGYVRTRDAEGTTTLALEDRPHRVDGIGLGRSGRDIDEAHQRTVNCT
jgi:hypothetical protein